MRARFVPFLLLTPQLICPLCVCVCVCVFYIYLSIILYIYI